MPFVARPYQNDAVRAVKEAFSRGVQFQLLSLPTGAGKTPIQGMLINTLDKRHGVQVVVVEFRRMLIEQTWRRFREDFGIEAEIEQGHHHANPDADVILASALTMVNRVDRYDEHRPRIWIIDEAHHVCAKETLSLLHALHALKGTPESHDFTGAVIGMSATPVRGDGQGLNMVFSEIVYHIDLATLVSQGYLVPPIYEYVESGINLAGVPVVEVEGATELDSRRLEKFLNTVQCNQLVVDSYLQKCRDLRTVVFCVSVAHAQALSACFNRAGVSAACVSYRDKKEAIKAKLAAFREGRVSVITNVDILGEGADFPWIEAVIMNSATASSSRYLQQVGRALRPCPEIGKQCARIIDIVHNSENFDLCSLPSIYGVPKKLVKKAKKIDVVNTLATLEGIKRRFPQIDIEKMENVFRLEDMREAKLMIAKPAEELMAATKMRWLQTDSRRYSVAVSAREYVIMERNMLDQYEVSFHVVGEESFTLGYAENAVTAAEIGRQHVAKTNPAALKLVSTDEVWCNYDPSEKQREYAEKNQIEVPEGATRGQLSLLIAGDIKNKQQKYFVRAMSMLEDLQNEHESLNEEQQQDVKRLGNDLLRNGSVSLEQYNDLRTIWRQVKIGPNIQKAKMLIAELDRFNVSSRFVSGIRNSVNENRYVSDKAIHILQDILGRICNEEEAHSAGR